MDHERDGRIRLRAHDLWARAGRPHGRHLEFWLAAEREALIEAEDETLEEGLEESFPASDTPSSLRRVGRG